MPDFLKPRRPFGREIANFLKRQVYCRIWRFAWSHQAQRRDLETTQELIEITRQAVAEKSYASVHGALASRDEHLPNKNFYDNLRYPISLGIVSRSLNKGMCAETDRSLTVCAIALKRYSLRHGKWPAGLDALVPEFMAAVPVDYMDGKPLKYRLHADGNFTLYSVGEDGRDDGGDGTMKADEQNPYNLWARKDCLWPAPALPEEVAAYRQKAARN